MGTQALLLNNHSRTLGSALQNLVIYVALKFTLKESILLRNIGDILIFLLAHSYILSLHCYIY